MKTLRGSLLAVLLVTSATANARPPVLATSDGDPPGSMILTRSDNTRETGRLVGDASTGFAFRVAGSNERIRLGAGMSVRFADPKFEPDAGLPPFRVEMALGQKLSGWMEATNGSAVTILGTDGRKKCSIGRAGVCSVVQRPGESLVFEEGFEQLDETRWVLTGRPTVESTLKSSGKKSLTVPPGETKLVHALRDPVGGGRFEAAFYDDGKIIRHHQWSVELAFRGSMGSIELIRVILGWEEDSLAVGSGGGPALAVQRLKRKEGWHRLGVRFGPEGTAISVDGDELAHGKGPDGPLVELRIAANGDLKPTAEIAGHLDELRLVRFEEPVGGLEIDAAQDDVRLSGGDQLFGHFQSASTERVLIEVDGSNVDLPWSEVSGIFFRRNYAQGCLTSGLLVRIEWKSAMGNDLRDLNVMEGALIGISDDSLSLSTAYAGTLLIPRERVEKMTVQGLGSRIVIDPTAHHLGDEVSAVSPLLDPPQPEGGILERSVELAEVPTEAVFLVLDVVGVVSESPSLPFSDLVKNNQLRTNLKLNGSPFDYLNHYIFSANETPERVRIPIPKHFLHAGKNSIRFELMGTKNNPNWLDDLGILTIALEIDPANTR